MKCSTGPECGPHRDGSGGLQAFWFTVFGPLLTMGRHIAVRVVHAGDLGLLTLLGGHLAALGVLGVTALPQSPFRVALGLA